MKSRFRLIVVMLIALGVAVPSLSRADLPAASPPTRLFSPGPDAYPRNFAIAVDDHARIFVGNADGVLIFDGAFWEKVALPNGDLVRSLAHDGNGRIYVGGYDAFGWIERGPTGRFVYHELSDRYAEVLGGELFADIRHIGIGAESVWFVGLEHLFRFDPDTGATGLVRHDGRFGPIARYRDEMVLQFRGEGLKVHRAGRWELLMGGAPARSLLTGLVSMPDDTLLVVASDGPWLRYDGRAFSVLPATMDVPHLASTTSALALDAQRIVLTTQLGSIIFHDLERDESEVIRISPGFFAGAARSRDGTLLFVDDLGAHALPWPAPWRYIDAGLAGTVHRILEHDGAHHVLTSSGLYTHRPGTTGFRREGLTDHEAWDLLPLEEGRALFADSYSVSVLDPEAPPRVIDDSTTVRELVRSPFDPDRVWAGTELGIQVLEHREGHWRSVLRNDRMDNLRITTLVETAPLELWVGSDRGGIQQLDFRTGADGALRMRATRIGRDQGLEYGPRGRASGAHIYRFDGDLIASTGAGLFVLRDGRFAPLAAAGGAGGFAAGIAVGQTAQLVEADGRLWAWTHGTLLRRDDEWVEVDLSELTRGGLSAVGRLNGQMVLGSLGRLLVRDPDIRPTVTPPAPLQLATALLHTRDTPDGRALPLDDLRIERSDSRLTLRYVLPDLANPDAVRYRTRLRPTEAGFSPWSSSGEQAFVGLEPGRYRFEVEAQDSRGRISRLQVPIDVDPEWHQRSGIRAAGAGVALLLLYPLASLFARRRARSLARERDRLELMVAERTEALREANARLDDLAHLDGLTRIPNRRRLDAYLEDVWRQGGERRRDLALAMIDVDHFKHYNDRFGHQAGDDLLTGLAGLLSRNLRRSEDLVARYGGEEFLVVLPGADARLAREVVEGMRRAVAESGLGVTISAGVHAAVPAADRPLEGMIEAADAALYRAKAGGRDRVEIG
jgi:diguanylate cyclase (GGDEF)-like protein